MPFKTFGLFLLYLKELCTEALVALLRGKELGLKSLHLLGVCILGG